MIPPSTTPATHCDGCGYRKTDCHCSARIAKLRPIVDKLTRDYASLDIIDAVISHMREIGIPDGAIAFYLSDSARKLRANNPDMFSPEESI